MNVLYCQDHPTITLFTKLSCPHCISFLPTYSKVKTNLKSSNVHFAEVQDGKKGSAQMFSKFNVASVPMLFVTDPRTNTTSEYTGPRTVDDLQFFIHQYV